MNRAKVINTIYYNLRPIIPRRFQIWMRRQVIFMKRTLYSPVWPILEKSGQAPPGWSGWPEDKKFALVLTHDVDTARGQQRCLQLASLEETLGFRSSFYFVPERYSVAAEIRQQLVQRGFEVGVHGLYHDGKLFSSRRIFKTRAARINMYLKEWKAIGFRSPAMHINLDWAHDLNIEYDASTFDTDPFEPQPKGVKTIFPFWVNGRLPQHEHGYVELPYTLPQDFTLFVLMKEQDIGIWQQKLDWIAERSGMALLDTHPDYMNFADEKPGGEEYPATYYKEFLGYIKTKYEGKYWPVLPKDLARFWSQNKKNHQGPN